MRGSQCFGDKIVYVIVTIVSQANTVTDALRQDILNGYFPPGARLVEAVVCDRYEISRASARAAFLALSAEGLVERETNRGATVRRVSPEEAVQITEARAVLECLIASEAAKNATDEDKADLIDIGEKMQAAVAEGDVMRYSELNTSLHRKVGETSRHDVARELIRLLRNRAVHHQYKISLVPGRPAESLGQHLAIIEAVVASDPEAADRAMRAHLDSVISVLRNWREINAY